MIDYNKINRSIDKYGEIVTIEDYSGKTYSDYGDLVTEITSEEITIKAIFNTYGRRTIAEKEGIFEEGNISFFFKGNQTSVDNENVVIRSNGDRWEIRRVDKHYLNGVSMVQEATVANE